MHRLVIALVALIGLTGATFLAAYFFLFAATPDRAAAMAPAQTAFYANLYLQPSAGQQMNLSELIGRLPGFADDASLDEKVDQVVQNLLAGTGVDYRTELKPWLGNQLAIAAWPVGEDATESAIVLIAEVKDREAAEASVDDLLAEGGAEFSREPYEGVDLHVADGSAYAFVDEMLVFGPDAAAVRAVVDVENGAASLADAEDFRSAMSDVPADHLASMFVDLAELAEATDSSSQLAGMSTAAAVLVAESDGLRLSGSAPFDRDAAPEAAQRAYELGQQPSELSAWMPAGTLAEVVVFGLRQSLEGAEATVRNTPGGQEIGSTIDTVRALAAFGLGIDLDDDVLPLLDREVGLAVSGFDGDLPSAQLLLRPADPDEAAAALDRIAERLTAIGATRTSTDAGGVEVSVLSIPDTGEVAYALVDGTVVIGLGADDVEAVVTAREEGTTLDATQAYTRTFALAGDRAGNEVFVDVSAVAALLAGMVELPDDGRDILERLGTFGFTLPSRDDHIEFHAVLTVEEP